MNLPPIINASAVFTKWAVNALNIQLSPDTKLLVDINRLWSNRNFFDIRENTPRIPGWEMSWPTHVLLPHKYSSVCDSLETIGDRRAQEILGRNLPIKFFWSGGIDSTFALSFLLANLKDPNQLTVYHTCHSLDENPEYVSHIKKHGVKMEYWSDLWETFFNHDDLIVSGTTADNLVASVDESFYADYLEWLQRPWQEYFLFCRMPHDKISLIEKKLSTHENTITTTLEARWWFYYSFRPQWWTCRDWNLNLENGPGHNVMCFYNCHEFDAWSQVNRNNFFYDNSKWITYKQVFKNEIFRMWPNEQFKVNKTKLNSGFNIHWGRRKAAQYNQQYLFIYLDKNGQAKTFRQKNWPFVDQETLLEELNEL